MLYRDISKILGNYLYGLTFLLILPFFLAFYYEHLGSPEWHPQPHSTKAFLYSIFICAAIAYAFSWIGRGASGHLYRREGLASIILIWFLTPALTALPLIISGTLINPFQAYFEMSSAITTTGCSVVEAKQYDPESKQEIPIRHTIKGELNTEYVYFGTITPVRNPVTQEIIYSGVEAVSKAILFWRSFVQWLGGVGIVVLFVSILPILGVGGKMLFQAEMAGPIKETHTPRIKEAAGQLLKIYTVLTTLQVILMLITNSDMSWLDAITTAFGTVSTGGLTIRNESIASYHSATTEWVVMIFMILGSTNFTLYYYFIQGKFYRLNEPEFWMYLGIIIVICLFAAWTLSGTAEELILGTTNAIYTASEAIRYGFFQLISSISTTGFYTADYDRWPYAVQAVMLLSMFVGGMAGSTAGGIKVIRYYMLFRICQFRVESLFQPEVVRKFKIGGREMDHGTILTVLCFFVIVITLLTLGTLFLIIDGVDLETALSVITCMITNTGMGFRMSGPKFSFAFLSYFGLILSSIWMILGRLEFFAVLVILLPSFWKQKQ